jgi:lysophospholipase L1-like esterase
MLRPRLKLGLLVGALLPVAGALAVQAVKLARTAIRNGRSSAASTWGRPPALQFTRVLLMGDSTGLGVGAQTGQSLAALLAAKHPEGEVLNVCRSGARLGDIARQLQRLPRSPVRWDLLLLHAGGTDVLRGTSPARMQREANALLQQLVPLARYVVWLGPPNIGSLPTFVPPFSWLLSRRSAHANELFKRCAEHFGVHYIDFHMPRGQEVFAADPLRFIAADLEPLGSAHSPRPGQSDA